MKNYVAVVNGYVRHGIYQQVEQMVHKHCTSEECNSGDYGVHIYPYNSEGYQLFVVSCLPIPSSCWLGSLLCETMDVDKDRFKSTPNGGIWELPEPHVLETDGYEYCYVGGIHGYDYDSSSPDDDRYEC